MSPFTAAVGASSAEVALEAVEGQQIVLHEWSTVRWRLDDGMARRLGETPWVSVATDREPGCWKVSTRQWVGAFSLGDLRIIVRPKIKPENLFFLLEVGLPSEAWQAESIDYAANDELLPALVSFFARTAETTLARGLFHHYRHEEDDLLALRGRIDFVRQFRRGGVLVPMACSWDDFTADVDENRCPDRSPRSPPGEIGETLNRSQQCAGVGRPPDRPVSASARSAQAASAPAAAKCSTWSVVGSPAGRRAPCRSDGSRVGIRQVPAW